MRNQHFTILLLCFAIVAVLFHSCEPEPTPLPVANFSVTNDGCRAPCDVSFTNNSFNEVGVTYEWNFGDGILTEAENPEPHRYTKGGNYLVRLTAASGVEIVSHEENITILDQITCNDGIQNGDETGVDCGGTSCSPCFTCADGIQNGFETGIDCGGNTCPACPTCSDGVQNGNETGIDCGGSFCGPCAAELCAAITCYHGGTCIINDQGIATCACPEGYYGPNCEGDSPCWDVACPSNSTPESPVSDNGTCTCFCNPGYEGENCDFESRSLITGDYGGKEYYATDGCDSDEYSYDVTITKSFNSILAFTINNFGGFEDLPANVECYIVGYTPEGNYQFVIPTHYDQDETGNRAIDSYYNANSDIYSEIGTYNVTNGILAISWRVLFSDGLSDQCTIVLEPK